MFDRAEVLRKLALDAARYSGLAALAKPLIGGVGAILMLHRVTTQPNGPLGFNSHLSITPDFLDRVIGDMKGRGYRFVSMDEAVDRIRAGAGHERFATITADDAYRDNMTEALPVFEKHVAPFTIYVAPGLIDGAVDLWWNVIEDIVGASDRIELPAAKGTITLDASSPKNKAEANRRLENYLTGEIPEEEQRAVVRELARRAGVDFDLPRREMLMNWDELRTIAGHPLATVGAHTVHHYSLRRLPAERAMREMSGSPGDPGGQAWPRAAALGLSLWLCLGRRPARSRHCRGSRLCLGGNDASRPATLPTCRPSSCVAAHFAQRPLPAHPVSTDHAFRHHRRRSPTGARCSSPFENALASGSGLWRLQHPLDDRHCRKDPE